MKKTQILLAALLFTGTVSFSQQYHEEKETEEIIIEEPKIREPKIRNQNEQDEIHTLTRNGHNGGFFGLTFKATEFKGEPVVTTGFRTGWIFGRAVGFGIEGHGIIPSAKYPGIDPVNQAILLGGYGGIFIEPVLFSNQVIHLTFPVAGGAGWMGYHEDWENNYEFARLIDEDLYWYVEPGVSVELNISKNFRLGLGVTQRFTQELDLINTPTDAFDNRNYFVTMKFGKF